VLREPRPVNDAELHRALEKIERRLTLVHQREAVRGPPGEDLIALRRAASDSPDRSRPRAASR
jgi:hypothetical protein